MVDSGADGRAAVILGAIPVRGLSVVVPRGVASTP